VAGHYQPLADNVAIAATSDQTLPSAVDSESEAKRTLAELRFASTSVELEAGRHHLLPPQNQTITTDASLGTPPSHQKSSGFAGDFYLTSFYVRRSASIDCSRGSRRLACEPL